jgi:peptidoglycan/LPS O-acetylase OafA/YrhL
MLLFISFVYFDSFLACFAFGIFCGYVRTRGVFDRLRNSTVARVVSFVAALASLIVGTYCNRIWPGWLLPSIVSSCILIFSVHSNEALIKYFSNGLSRWLGRLSYPLYLVQFPVIVSFTSYLVVSCNDAGLRGSRINWLVIFLSAIVSLAAAIVFRPVESLAHRAADVTSLGLRAAAKHARARGREWIDEAASLAASWNDAASASSAAMARLRPRSTPSGIPAARVELSESRSKTVEYTA